MKIGPILDVCETDDRREQFKNNVASGKWLACVASADLGYFIPIIKAHDGFRHSLPIEFRRLGIKRAHKKSFFDARREAEHRIVEAASIRGDSVPMLVFFDPPEKKTQPWKRTRNVFDCRQQFGADVEVRRFRPQEIGWRECVRRVISLNVSPATKIVLLYAYDRGFESGEFFASTETVSKDTNLNARHIKRILPQLVKLKHLERVKRDPKGVWRYAFLGPIHELPRGDLKSPEERIRGIADDPKSSAAVTLSPRRGDPPSPKADISNQKDSSRSTREGESDQKTPTEMDKATRSYCEKELLDHLSRIMGPVEMLKNAPAWRLRIRFYHSAITGAIKEYYGLSQNERDKIKNRAAWMIDRFGTYGGRSITDAIKDYGLSRNEQSRGAIPSLPSERKQS